MSYATAFGVRPDTVYAGFSARMAAYLIDGVILWVAGNLMLGSLDYVFQMNGMMRPEDRLALGRFLRPLMGMLYFIALEGGASATIGKMMMQVRVETEDGAPVGFARSVGRNLGKVVSVVILGLGFLMPLWTARRQALHDMMAKCVVVRAR